MRGVVAIVGRPNVGKSSLFNRIVGERVSITDDASGITRDRIYSKATWLNQEFIVIDTGGIILKDEPFSQKIRAQAMLAIDEADLIVMVVDVRTGITYEDDDVIDILKKSNKPIIIAVNKVDDQRFLDDIYDFYRFGVDDVIPVSSLHGIGIGDLLDKIVHNLPRREADDYDEKVIRYSLIGQPNVGKSTLANAILGEERVIVSDIPGTTRDAIDAVYSRDGRDYVVIDTAGIRKRGKIYERAEKYSLLRALAAIERSDIAVIMLDGTTPVTEQDKRIAGYARENYRAAIFAVNKWDIVEKDDKTMKRMTEEIKNNFLFLDYAPVVFISAKNKQRINTLLDEIDRVYESFTRRIPTNILNDIITDAVLLNQPPEFEGARIKIYYATQDAVKPPSIVLFVNDPKHMHFSYLRYLENQIRNSFEFSGTPIKFVLRKKE
ncbi:MAG: ribosome biogenesis GTPase Der [Bacilli bacterium]|jgi:GTP-binding protein|nr:ribosome biogenesis GTPase Der [Bacillota bacterium]NLM31763.1 ribosome biogenesis GTPase Der [Acholeplasmataceae bacterium]HOA78512.1 ribosome biogenesis GTPase Der [Bacilli bacterium]HPZ27464.1 ribosome biogenesis GTPase Der [Bacilli bacterium]HQC89832.1 ribosome biogenesis GTPase Der [Bacilli bacterium]